MPNNIFSRLARYAYQQDENFLTEALVYLLNLILEKEEQAGLSLLTNICGKSTTDWFSAASEISITTQFPTPEGRPDIVIQSGDDRIIFIEIKHDASLGVNQLERYYAHLESLGIKHTQLVLLTRSQHALRETSLDRQLFHHVCWYEISGWLSEARLQNEVTLYTVEQFLDFLKQKEMSMEKVTWEYIQGVPAMVNLINMIGTALSEAAPESSVRKTVGSSWGGFYVDGIFVGFRYAEPLLIVFENNSGTNPTFKRDLPLEKAHFFSLNSGEQLECLIDFIQTSIEEYARRDDDHPNR